MVQAFKYTRSGRVILRVQREGEAQGNVQKIKFEVEVCLDSLDGFFVSGTNDEMK